MTTNTNRLHFPAKIYLILENESPDIIRWHPNNKAFRINDHQRFEREIIPKYFRHNQMSSVQRQLNLYGFRCVSRGEDKGSFYHPNFQRGEWEKVKLIRRCVQNHNQLGFQHWKMPQDMKSFVDNTDVKDLEDLPDHDNVTRMGAHHDSEPSTISSNMSQSSMMSKPMIPRRNDWAWPPVHVLEQQRTVNTTIVKAFQSSSDLASELVHNVSSQPANAPNEISQQPSMLTSRLGFRWNIHVEPIGNDVTTARSLDHYQTSSSSSSTTAAGQAQANHFFPDVTYDNVLSSNGGGMSSHPSDTFEELIEICQDLDSFLEDCDATTVW